MEILVVKSPKLLWEEEIRGFLDRVSELSPEAAVLIGWCGFSTHLIKELRKRKYFLVTSPYDDIAVTKEARKYGVLLDGKAVRIKDIIIGGVGGLNPIQDIGRLSRILGSRITLNILVSYYPPYGCGDLVHALGVRKGLQELTEIIKEIKLRLLVSGGNASEVCRLGSIKALALGEELNSVTIIFHNSLIDASNFFRLP